MLRLKNFNFPCDQHILKTPSSLDVTDIMLTVSKSKQMFDFHFFIS